MDLLHKNLWTPRLLKKCTATALAPTHDAKLAVLGGINRYFNCFKTVVPNLFDLVAPYIRDK